MSITRFLIYFVLFNILLAIPPFVIHHHFKELDLLIPRFDKMFIVFSIITFVIYLFASWRMSVSVKSSGQALLASIAVKLLLYMVIAFVYISQNTVNPAKFMICFFYLYFFHTVFEIYCLLCNLRNQKIK
ncbi:hypothetical protein SAMN05661099_2053 [Daejeonella lutea]|uniref:Uncharacterized protein n=1 Tax=Daejeonella lutea TaxID=572036 RepID=A0A1T5CYW3_9SPHI|nr:hypothetical protein SAMN05661099_2053 [Daejeonella lutea]